jgi:hypothetical protein
MKKDQVKIGGLYHAKVSDKLVTVRIDSTNTHGGWNATNTATGRRIRIKRPQRLRGAAGDAAGADDGKAEVAVATEDQAEPAGGDTPTRARKARAGKAATKAKTKKATRGPKAKRVSALDAAAQVLAKAGKPMRAQELVAAMAEQGLWSSPNGKTPHATLYAAMMREERDKGGASRFRKVDRGLFEFSGKVA